MRLATPDIDVGHAALEDVNAKWKWPDHRSPKYDSPLSRWIELPQSSFPARVKSLFSVPAWKIQSHGANGRG